MKYALLLLLILSGCASAPQNGIQIVWHKLDGKTHLFGKIAGQPTAYGNANGYYRMVDGVCHIWAPDPPTDARTYRKDQWATLGHEIKHCFDGKFHD